MEPGRKQIRSVLEDILEGYDVGEPQYYVSLDCPGVIAIEELIRQARLDEMNELIGRIGPLIPGETWHDWSWRVKNDLATRLTQLANPPRESD